MEKCRLCLIETMEVKNILTHKGNTNVPLSEIVKMFFNIQIRPDDLFTKFICCNCISMIEYIDAYCKTVKSNQIQLIKDIFKNNTDGKYNNVIKPTYKVISKKEQIKTEEDLIPFHIRHEDLTPHLCIVPLEQSPILRDYKKISNFTYKKIVPYNSGYNLRKRKSTSITDYDKWLGNDFIVYPEKKYCRSTSRQRSYSASRSRSRSLSKCRSQSVSRVITSTSYESQPRDVYTSSSKSVDGNAEERIRLNMCSFTKYNCSESFPKDVPLSVWEAFENGCNNQCSDTDLLKEQRNKPVFMCEFCSKICDSVKIYHIHLSLHK